MHGEVDGRAARYVAVGDVVAGSYLVERVLAVGDTTFVVAARHLDSDELFALEFLTTPFLNDTVVARFVREARSACRIRNMHAARVYGVGTHEGAPFMILDLAQGRDLSAMLLGEGPLRVDDVVELALHACEGLAAAHEQGVVHRHVTPENLFVVEHAGRRCLKVLDAGISRAPHADLEERRHRFAPPSAFGAPGYLAPEQIRSSASADERSDIWSLGVVLYELLSGTPAFTGVTVTELCASVLESTPTPLTQLRSAVPRALADVVATAMEKDSCRRFATMADLAIALLPFARPAARSAAARWCLAARASLREEPGDGASVAAHDQWWPHRAAVRVLSSAPTSWSHSSGEGMLPPPPRVHLPGASSGANGDSNARARATGSGRVGFRAGVAISLATLLLGVTTVLGVHHGGAASPRPPVAASLAAALPSSPSLEGASADATSRALREEPKPASREAPTTSPSATSTNVLVNARGFEKPPRALSSAVMRGVRRTFAAATRPPHSASSTIAPSVSPGSPARRVDLGY